VIGPLIAAFLLIAANARVASSIGERWDVDTGVGAPRWGLLVLADTVIWVMVGMPSSWSAALGLAPIVALLTFVAIRQSRPHARHTPFR
jgi:hypothetical protein